MFIAPVVYLILLSLMTSNQALTNNYWPQTWHPENYVEVFRRTPLPRYLLNTVVYSALATGFMLVASVPAGYALAKLRWRGRNLTFLTMICMMMLPPRRVAHATEGGHPHGAARDRGRRAVPVRSCRESR